MKGSNSRLRAARGSITQELSRNLAYPQTREDMFITMEVTTTLEEDRITTMVLRMGMGTEPTIIITAPTQPHPPKGT